MGVLRGSRRIRGYPPWSPTWTESPATSFAAEKAFGWIMSLGLRWFPIKIERGAALTRGMENSWWREWRGGGTGGDGIGRDLAATEPAGLGEDGLPLLDCWPW